jgi:hypothetical protein
MCIPVGFLLHVAPPPHNHRTIPPGIEIVYLRRGAIVHVNKNPKGKKNWFLNPNLAARLLYDSWNFEHNYIIQNDLK